MPIAQTDLRSASARVNQRSTHPGGARATAFLCHSHKDRDLALGLQQLLREQGLDNGRENLAKWIEIAAGAAGNKR
jgi:hypothetical protein